MNRRLLGACAAAMVALLTSTPSTAATCQELSDTYAIVAGKGFGYAGSDARASWIAQRCNTSPAPARVAALCQTLSTGYQIHAGRSWGTANTNVDVQGSWAAMGCTANPTKFPPDIFTKLVGSYRHDPVQNAWHTGKIVRQGDGMRWVNDAGVSWALFPDMTNNRLFTGPDNPYFASYPNLREFKLIATNGQITGFDFGGSYMRQDLPAQAQTGAAPVAAAPVERVDPLAQRFAPVLLYDRAAQPFGFPMSAQGFYEAILAKDPRLQHESSPGIKNVDPATLTNASIPTYYQVIRHPQTRQVRIRYWWFYGMQEACNTSGIGSKTGRHHADWESMTVILTQDSSKIAAVTFFQHNNHYTRISGPRDAPCTPSGTGRCESNGFETWNGTHPIAYIEKISHGSFHNRNSGGPGGCGYYEGFRNPGSPPMALDSSRKLLSLDGNSEAWIGAARAGKIERWGPPDSTSKAEGAISTNPVRSGPTFSDRACEGSATWLAASAGCYKSECLAGDDQAAANCLKECRPGYDNVGLTCNKGKWPWEWSVYGRLDGGNMYNYNYVLPPIDSGLSRRRVNGEPW